MTAGHTKPMLRADAADKLSRAREAVTWAARLANVSADEAAPYFLDALVVISDLEQDLLGMLGTDDESSDKPPNDEHEQEDIHRGSPWTDDRLKAANEAHMAFLRAISPIHGLPALYDEWLCEARKLVSACEVDATTNTGPKQ